MTANFFFSADQKLISGLLQLRYIYFVKLKDYHYPEISPFRYIENPISYLVTNLYFIKNYKNITYFREKEDGTKEGIAGNYIFSTTNKA